MKSKSCTLTSFLYWFHMHSKVARYIFVCSFSISLFISSLNFLLIFSLHKWTFKHKALKPPTPWLFLSYDCMLSPSHIRSKGHRAQLSFVPLFPSLVWSPFFHSPSHCSCKQDYLGFVYDCHMSKCAPTCTNSGLMRRYFTKYICTVEAYTVSIIWMLHFGGVHDYCVKTHWHSLNTYDP